MDTLDHGSLEKMPILPIRQRWNLLVMGIVLTVISFAIQFYQALELNGLVNRIEAGDEGAAYQLEAIQREGFTSMKMLGFLISVASVVFICMWIYRAAQNVHSAGMQNLNYSPGWNVGWFFIPLIHIIMPAIVLRETVKATQSINDRGEYSSWPNNRVMGAYMIWAVCFCLRMLIVYGTMVYAVSLMRELAEHNSDALVKLYKNSVLISYASIAISIVELIALYLFSKKVTNLQEQYRAE